MQDVIKDWLANASSKQCGCQVISFPGLFPWCQLEKWFSVHLAFGNNIAEEFVVVTCSLPSIDDEFMVMFHSAMFDFQHFDFGQITLFDRLTVKCGCVLSCQCWLNGIGNVTANPLIVKFGTIDTQVFPLS